MAESQAVIRLNATDDGATSTIQKVGAATDTATNSTVGLKKQLRELQAELATLDPQSAKFQELSSRAGQVKDQINDASEAIRANAGSAFEQLSNNASNLGSRLLNLDFEGVSQSANALGGNLGKLKFGDLTNGIKSFGSTMMNLGRTILMNPLFLIPALIVGLIAGLYALKDSIPGVAAAFEFIGDTIGAVVDGIKSFTDWIGVTDFAATEQLEKATSERDSLIGELDRQEKRAKALARKNGQDILAVEKEYADKRRKVYESIVAAAENKVKRGAQLSEEEIKNLQDANNAIYELDTADINRAADADEKAKQEQEKREAEAQRKREQAAAEAERKRQQARQKAEQERQRAEQERQKQEEERKRAEEKLNQDIAAIQEQQRLSKLSKDEVELIESQKKFDALAAQAKGNAEALAQIEELRIAEEEAIRKRQFEERQAQEQALEEQRIKTIEENAAKEAEIKKKADEEELARIAEVNAAKLEAQRVLEDSKLAIAAGAIDLAKAVAGKSEKAANAIFLVEKALAIANVIVSTQREIAGYYSNPTWSLLPDGGLAIKSAMATSAKIRAGLSIATIVATSISKFKGGSASTPSTGGGGGGGGSMGMSLATAAGGGGGGGVAQFNPLNTNFVNNRPGQVSQTYVLAGDVANAQEARNRVQDLARL